MHRHTICRLLVLSLCLAVMGFAPVAAQERPSSPEGAASTQIGDAWIDITYSRPILRGRNGIFGAGDEYGQALNPRGGHHLLPAVSGGRRVRPGAQRGRPRLARGRERPGSRPEPT